MECERDRQRDREREREREREAYLVWVVCACWYIQMRRRDRVIDSEREQVDTLYFNKSKNSTCKFINLKFILLILE